MTGFFGGLVTFLALGLPIGIAMAAVGLIGVVVIWLLIAGLGGRRCRFPAPL